MTKPQFAADFNNHNLIGLGSLASDLIGLGFRPWLNALKQVEDNFRLLRAWKGAASEVAIHTSPEEFDPRTAFNIPRSVRVTSDAISPFCNLHHFEHARGKEGITFFNPNSGKSSVIGRDAVEAFMSGYNVHMVEWVDPRLVSLSSKNPSLYDLEDLTDDALKVMLRLPKKTAVGTSQSGLPVILASSLLAMRGDRAQPQNIIILGSPLHPGLNPTEYTRAAKLGLNADHLSVRAQNGRWVLPGEVLQATFASLENHRPFEGNLQPVPLPQIKQTLERAFQNHLLAEGRYRHRGILVDTHLITARLMTIVASDDKIVDPLQTQYARSIMPNAEDYRDLVISGAKHSDLVTGDRYRKEVAPQMKRFIAESQKAGLH